MLPELKKLLTVIVNHIWLTMTVNSFLIQLGLFT